MQTIPVCVDCDVLFPCNLFVLHFFYLFGTERSSFRPHGGHRFWIPWFVLDLNFFQYLRCTWKKAPFSTWFLDYSWILSFCQNLVHTDSGTLTLIKFMYNRNMYHLLLQSKPSLIVLILFRINYLRALTLEASTSQNSQTHSNNLFKCVWPFCVLALKWLRNIFGDNFFIQLVVNFLPIFSGWNYFPGELNFCLEWLLQSHKSQFQIMSLIPDWRKTGLILLRKNIGHY